MSARPVVTAEAISRLSGVADLALPADRQPALAAMFAELVTAANELSRKMADAKYRTVVPIVGFAPLSGS
jgi:hypothetical protein